MSKINILIVAAVLLSSVVLASVARPDSTLQSKSTEIEKNCETDECLMKTTSDAHLDYIYTQNPPPRAPKEMETKCETEECLMKTTSDAHLDYIYTQTHPPKPHAFKVNP
ncbi:growth factor [Arabidopsis thaliana]|uniref:Phytosulfokine n=1 Tax=Arabidopsis thaliana TaxID=3702 RepID=B3H4C2_ARATH|nr:growth factor [Arabidopsis thaliana]AEC07379.1 growth factor [Arabidopsis thaliana]|eukprot:NP_001118365.4 growth factor [Arabidopsis thaliana]